MALDQMQFGLYLSLSIIKVSRSSDTIFDLGKRIPAIQNRYPLTFPCPANAPVLSKVLPKTTYEKPT